MRLNARGSKYHEATGTVDAHELERVRGKDKAISLKLDDGNHTVAFGDELEAIDAPPPGGSTDNGKRHTP